MTMTARFDDWEGQYLAHFRTRGSKNGVRRYQTESGEWTPLGLRERAKREGWGSEERKARRAERKAERSEKRAAASTARKERIAAYKEERRKNNPKTMTTEELKAKIERAELEKEYRELYKSPARQLGEKIVQRYFENKEAKAKRMDEQRARDFEMMKMKEQTKQAEIRKSETEARSKADSARAEADKAKAATDKLDIEKGTRMKQLKLDTKKANSALTIHGGIMRAINTMTVSRAERRSRAKEGRRAVNKIFRSRNRVRRYNEKHPNDQMGYDPNEWNRWGSPVKGNNDQQGGKKKK